MPSEEVSIGEAVFGAFGFTYRNDLAEQPRLKAAQLAWIS
jgi:hypothetical protein